MANTQRLRKSDRNQITMYSPDSATVIEVGDMVYQEVDDVRPASDLTYGATLAATQAQFAKQFVGVAMGASASGETAKIPVAKAGVFEFDCAAAQFEIGDLIGPDDNGAGDTLEDQQVIAMGESGVGGIGRVAKRYSANTTSVLVRITPRDQLPDQLIPITFPTQLIENAVDLVTDWVVPFPFKLVRADAVVTVLTAGACAVAIHKNATALDDVITVPTASAVGAVIEQAIDDATGDDIFDMGDTLSIASDGVPTAGEVAVILWVKPYYNES